MSLSNYPPGADNEWAPWNDPEIPEKEFGVCVSQTLSKSTSIYTDDTPGAEGCDYEPDGEGGYCASGWKDPDDTSYTDWVKAYHNSAMTPLDIIGACEKIAKALLEEGKTRFAGLYLKSLVKECEDWNEDELEVMEE